MNALPPPLRAADSRRGFLLAIAGALAACASPQPQRSRTTDPGTGDEIAIRAMSLIGKPYVWGGNDPAEGLDCSGLVQHVYKAAAGIRLPRQAARMGTVGEQIQRNALAPGDLVFFNTQRRRFSHVGIYVGEGRFVHAPSRGKTIRLANLGNPFWTKRYDGARRPGL